jgi:RNA polymerase sigma factor for flagellar operon FliA
MLKKAYGASKQNEREKTIEEFIPIIKHLAYKVSRGYEDEMLIDDLISAGTMGLLEAMEKYDSTRGIKLNTYAYLRIKGAMIDELRARDWFPRSARAKAKKIDEVIRGLEARLGRYPREDEVAGAMGMDTDDYLEMLKDYGNLSVVSIEDLSEASGEERGKIIQYVIDEGEDPEQHAEFREMERILAHEVERLPERQRLVLTLYYHEDLNMKEIAATLGITEARVCQIHSQAVLCLRSSMSRITRASA